MGTAFYYYYSYCGPNPTPVALTLRLWLVLQWPFLIWAKVCSPSFSPPVVDDVNWFVGNGSPPLLDSHPSSLRIVKCILP